jgi:protein kinase X
VDWDLVKNREIPPPWVPSMTGEDDTQYYDEYPDSTDKVDEPPEEDQELFTDF